MSHSKHRTNSDIINTLKSCGIIKSPSVERVMSLVDRKYFTIYDSYVDTTQTIGFNATISAPHIHAHALEFFKDRLSKPKCRALDIGCGSGYLTLCMYLMDSDGLVVGVDHFNELINYAKNNVINAGFKHHLDSGAVQFTACDGREGYPPWRPYDAIYVGASVPTVPQALLDQLGKGGAMLIPVGSSNQQLTVYERDEDGQISCLLDEFRVRFDPLMSKNAQFSRK